MSDGLRVISTFPFSVESQEKAFGMRVLAMRYSFPGETHDADVDQSILLGAYMICYMRATMWSLLLLSPRTCVLSCWRSVAQPL